MNSIVFLSLNSAFGNIFSPELDTVYYVENNVNVSWNKEAFSGLNTVNIFLLHNDFISEYHNGTDILNRNIQNIGYYNWIPEYDLNKYIYNDTGFKVLISSNNEPFSTTIGESITNLFSNNFILRSNVNITNPVEDQVLYSNDVTNIILNGYKNNLTCHLYYDNKNIIDTFYIENPSETYEYIVSDNIQYFNREQLSLEIIEDNTNISRTIPHLRSAGINIDNGNIEIYDNEIINITWVNNYYYGENRVFLKNSSYYTIYSEITNENRIELNFSDSFGEDLYFLSVYSEDMQLNSFISINKIISPVTLSHSTTPTPPFVPINDEERRVIIIAAFGVFVVLVCLATWWYLRENKETKKRRTVHPSPVQAPTQLPPIRIPTNSFYPSLENIDDTDIHNVYVPINKQNNDRNPYNEIYQETNSIHNDRPILNNFTYGNPAQEPELDTTYIKDQLVSDHEYDEPEEFHGNTTIKSQEIYPPKVLPRKSNTQRRKSKKRSGSRKEKSNEKRPWRPSSPNPVREDYREVERRTRRRSRTKSLVNNKPHEYNVLDIDDNLRINRKSTEYNVLERPKSTHASIPIPKQDSSTKTHCKSNNSSSDRRISYSKHRKSVQLSSPVFSEFDNVHYTKHPNYVSTGEDEKIIKQKLERETEYY
jgi:hypothetical protein